MIFRGRRLIATCFNSVMQQLFKHHPKFYWKPNPLETKIYINESFGRSDRKYPCVITSDVSNGSFFNASYDRNFQNDVYGENGEIIGSRYGSSMNASFNISISALDKYTCEILADEISSFFEFHGVHKFRDAGITITNITASSVNTESYGKENIYTIVLTFQVYAEWEKYVTPEEYELIEKITIPYIGVIYNSNNEEKVWPDVQE